MPVPPVHGLFYIGLCRFGERLCQRCQVFGAMGIVCFA